MGHFWPLHRFAARVDLGPRRADASGSVLISARSPISVVFSHSRMIWKSATSSRPVSTGVVLGVVDLLPAGVIVAPLHVADLQRPREVLLEERDVLEEELLLQVLGAGGDDDALAGEQRRHQVGERLAGARAGLDDQVALVGERGFDGLGHLHLARRGIRNSDATWTASRRGQRTDGRWRCGPEWASGWFDSNKTVHRPPGLPP